MSGGEKMEIFQLIGKKAFCDFREQEVTVKELIVRTRLYSKKGKLLFSTAVLASSPEEAKEKTLKEAERYTELKRVRRFFGDVEIVGVIYVKCPLCHGHHLNGQFNIH